MRALENLKPSPAMNNRWQILSSTKQSMIDHHSKRRTDYTGDISYWYTGTWLIITEVYFAQSRHAKSVKLNTRVIFDQENLHKKHDHWFLCQPLFLNLKQSISFEYFRRTGLIKTEYENRYKIQKHELDNYFSFWQNYAILKLFIECAITLKINWQFQEV